MHVTHKKLRIVDDITIMLGSRLQPSIFEDSEKGSGIRKIT